VLLKRTASELHSASLVLATDERDAGEYGDDAEPLPARHFLVQDYSREENRYRAIQRGQDAYDRDLLKLHAQIVQHERACIQHAHAEQP